MRFLYLSRPVDKQGFSERMRNKTQKFRGSEDQGTNTAQGEGARKPNQASLLRLQPGMKNIRGVKL